MYGPEHYISKLERNVNVVGRAPEHVRAECLRHITWARELIRRLQLLDYPEREQAINKIHEVLDYDYQTMGFELPQKVDEGRHM